MERGEIEAAIRSAFAGVRLGSGVSIRQAQAIDDAFIGRGLSRAEFDRLRASEVTDDWARVPEWELTRDCIAHLDADGLRYYLPALMLWLLEHYEDEGRASDEFADMTAIGTISALAFPREFEESYEATYETFTAEQRSAIASYLHALPRLIDLDHEDGARVARSVQRYWAQFLGHTPSDQPDST